MAAKRLQRAQGFSQTERERLKAGRGRVALFQSFSVIRRGSAVHSGMSTGF